MQRLYELGARRVIVTGTGPLGCVPAELALHSQNGECAAELTRAVNLFNPQMVDMVRGLNRAIGADVFVTANTYRMNFDYLANPQDFGERRRRGAEPKPKGDRLFHACMHGEPKRGDR